MESKQWQSIWEIDEMPPIILCPTSVLADASLPTLNASPPRSKKNRIEKVICTT